MIKIKMCISLVLTSLLICNVAFANPYRGEEGLVVRSGLTDNGKSVGCETESHGKAKLSFNRDVKKIIYWITVDLAQLKSYDTLQSVEWYMPNGKIWIKENRDVFKEGSLIASKSCKKDILYTLKTGDIPRELDGVWALRFLWSDRPIDERYFRFGTGGADPSDLEISELKKKIRTYNDAMFKSELNSQYKYASYLCTDSKGYYHEQTIFQPRFSFLPDEKIKYTLNLIPSSLGQMPIMRLFIFSPDGKIQKKYILAPFAPMTAYKQSALCEQKIDLKKITMGMPDIKGSSGLWKLQAYYLDTDMPMDEKYFYIDPEARDNISPDDITLIDGRITKEGIVNSLDWGEKKVIENAPKLNWNKDIRSRKKLKVGMSKNDVIAILGNPDKIITDEYDDAEVFIYLKPRDIIGTNLPSAGIALAIDILAAQKLKIIIKDDHVVGIRRGA